MMTPAISIFVFERYFWENHAIHMYTSEKEKKMKFIDKGWAGVTGLLGSLRISHCEDR